MRVVVIGGTGHIGTYLTPRLVQAGHEVVCVSRGMKTPYRDNAAWKSVKNLFLDRDAEERAASFGEKIAALDSQVVIDLTCYLPESASQLAESLKGRVEHLLHCGTIWVHGHSSIVPTAEDAPRAPFGEYGIRKAAIEQYLLGLSRLKGLPVTILHPGHLVGTGWNPVNPQGNFNPAVFTALARGETIVLPNIGMETLHHVHADDVSMAFLQAMARRSTSVGEAFHIVSAAALTMRGYAQRMAEWFGTQADLKFQPWEMWKTTASERDAQHTWDHIAHSPHCSISKAQQLLQYRPRYSSLEAIQESVADMERRGVVLSK